MKCGSRTIAAAVVLVLLQCAGGRAIRVELSDDEKELHPNELSVIVPGSLAVHPDDAVIGSTASLSLNVSSPIEDGDFVAVSVHSSDPGSSDWVALYCPGDSEYVKTVVPANYAVIGLSNPNYAATGNATVRFQMINMRTSCAFYLFKDAWETGSYSSNPIPKDVTDIAIAISDTVHFRDANAPGKVRVMVEPNDGLGAYSFRVMWSSLRGTAGNPKLQWWVPDCERPVVFSANATTSTYTADDLCDAPANSWGYRDIGMINEAVIDSINPRHVQSVQYRVGDDVSGWTKNFTLQVPPSMGNATTKTVLALFGDMGRGTVDDSITWHEYGAPAVQTSLQLEDDATNGRIDAIFHFGDISYATGYSSIWDTYLHQIQSFATQVPYMINLGNHEYDSPLDTWKSGYTPSIYDVSDSHGECGVPAMSLFKTPRKDFQHSWWSYDIGNIHIISINSEVDFSEGSAQLEFVKSDLASVNRCNFPWIILGAHRPMYIDSTYKGNPTGDIDVMLELQKYVEPVMVEYNVTLGLYGHNHAYQRHCASYQSKCMQRSDENMVHWYPHYPVHLVAGTAGAHFTKNANFAHPADFTELVFYEYGYGRLTAHNSTHLGWEFVSSVNGSVLDSMTIVQDPSKFPCPNNTQAYLPTCSEVGSCKPVSVCESSGAHGGEDEGTGGEDESTSEQDESTSEQDESTSEQGQPGGDDSKSGHKKPVVIIVLATSISLVVVAAAVTALLLMRNSKKPTYDKVACIEME